VYCASPVVWSPEQSFGIGWSTGASEAWLVKVWVAVETGRSSAAAKGVMAQDRDVGSDS